MSSRWIEGVILNDLHSNNIVGPNKPADGRAMYNEMEKEGEEGFSGAYVKETTPGLYSWVYSADIISLYPSVMMSLNISNETKIGKIENWNRSQFDNNDYDYIKLGDKSYTADEFRKFINGYKYSIASNGAVYKNDRVGVIPKILNKWFSDRIQYRKLSKEYLSKGDKVKFNFYNLRQQRQKIFLNSFYGSTGLAVFRFYDRDNAEAVTTSGQDIIKGAEKVVNAYYLEKYKEHGVVPEANDFVIGADTDSNYISSLPMAKLDNISPDKILNYTIELSKDVTAKINRFYQYMIPRIFNVSSEKNRIKIISDVIAKKALWLAKKHYALLKVYDMEKNIPVIDKDGREGKIEFKGIDVVRSSYPASFRKFSSEILDMLLREGDRNVIDEKIMKFEENIAEKSVLDLAKTTSVKFISKDGNINYNPKGRHSLQFVKGTPVGVKAALCYNDLLKIWKLNKQCESIMHGSKIKWVYTLPNEFCIEQLAIKSDDADPDQILEFIETHVDRRKMYDRELYRKLNEIYNCIGWSMPNRGSQLASKTFNFSEEF
jgi:DNA polymerase elongation subunit (family B)